MELLGQRGYVYLNLINVSLGGPQSGCTHPIYLAFRPTPLSTVPKEGWGRTKAGGGGQDLPTVWERFNHAQREPQ